MLKTILSSLPQTVSISFQKLHRLKANVGLIFIDVTADGFVTTVTCCLLHVNRSLAYFYKTVLQYIGDVVFWR